MRSITVIAIVLAAASASAIEIKDQKTRLQPRRPDLPPMPMESLLDDPAESVDQAEEADPKSAYAQIVARQQDRAIHTQRTARVKGEILAAVETDTKGNKTAKVIRADGSIEMRPIKTLHTARLKPLAPAAPPIDGSHAAAAAAGALAAAAAAAAIAKKRGTK
jgi:hypothetical protein